MKKALIVIISLVIMTSLIACSNKEDEEVDIDVSPTQAEELKEEPTPTQEPTPTEVAEPNQAEEVDNTDKKLVALTFDDGPNNQTTTEILDILEEHDVVASFFLIGKNVTEATKPVIERQLELGCEIANHSWSHNAMNNMKAEEIKDQIQKTNDIIYEMVGVTPAFFRPPYILVSPEMHENIDLPFISGINCLDWEVTVSAKERTEGVLSKVKDGDIVLLHDFNGNKNTVDALPDIIQGLKDDGFVMVTVSQLFELKGVDPRQDGKLWNSTQD